MFSSIVRSFAVEETTNTKFVLVVVVVVVVVVVEEAMTTTMSQLSVLVYTSEHCCILGFDHNCSQHEVMIMTILLLIAVKLSCWVERVMIGEVVHHISLVFLTGLICDESLPAFKSFTSFFSFFSCLFCIPL